MAERMLCRELLGNGAKSLNDRKERNDTFNDKQSKNRRAKNWGATEARKKETKYV